MESDKKSENMNPGENLVTPTIDLKLFTTC
jgi:hypothetical protein